MKARQKTNNVVLNMQTRRIDEKILRGTCESLPVLFTSVLGRYAVR